MSIKKKILVGLSTAFLLPLSVKSEVNPEDLFRNYSPEEVPFIPMDGVPGATYAVLFGNPSQPGIYVMRYRVPAGMLIPPHKHNQDRHVTVISGTWAFGKGTSGQCGDALPMAPGSYVFHPRNAMHYDGSCTEQPVEVQVIGYGPVDTTLFSDGPQ